MSRRYVCYLICFRDPQTGEPTRYHHAGHYLGHTEARRLDERVAEHRNGRGAVLTAVVRQAGLDFKVTRTWDGGSLKERQLKTRSGALYCPDCSEHPLPGTRPRRAGAEYLTRRQREDRQREQAEEPRLPLYELERMGTDLDGNPLPDPTDRVPARSAHREEPQMSAELDPGAWDGDGPAGQPGEDPGAAPEEDDQYEDFELEDYPGGVVPDGDTAHLAASWEDGASHWSPPATPDPRDLQIRLDPQSEFDFAVYEDAAASERLGRETSRLRTAELNASVHPSDQARLEAEQAQQLVRQAWSQHVTATEDAYTRAAQLQDAAPEPPAYVGEPLPRMLHGAVAVPTGPVAAAQPDGTPHPDQRQAEHGWQAQCGVYQRQAPAWQADREAV